MIGLVDEPALVLPEAVGRCSWDVHQARTDVAALAWIGRFRFVTAEALSARFGVSWQRANARVRRLERLGLVGCSRDHVSQPRAIFLTGRGFELLGQPRRRAPRARVQREHEAAVVWLVTQLEREARAGLRVLTERECRRLEAADARRASVMLDDGRRRWADVVVESVNRRQAIEIEFSPKGSSRLAQIVAAYACSDYCEVLFFVRSVTLGVRISGCAFGARVRVLPWPGLPAAQRAWLARALAQGRDRASR